MCRFYFYEMIRPIYFLLIVHSMSVKHSWFMLRKFKDLNLNINPPKCPPPHGYLIDRGLKVNNNYMPPWIQNINNFPHFDKIVIIWIKKT
jgi:hypothetical protein